MSYSNRNNNSSSLPVGDRKLTQVACERYFGLSKNEVNDLPHYKVPIQNTTPYKYQYDQRQVYQRALDTYGSDQGIQRAASKASYSRQETPKTLGQYNYYEDSTPGR